MLNNFGLTLTSNVYMFSIHNIPGGKIRDHVSHKSMSTNNNNTYKIHVVLFWQTKSSLIYFWRKANYSWTNLSKNQILYLQMNLYNMFTKSWWKNLNERFKEAENQQKERKTSRYSKTGSDVPLRSQFTFQSKDFFSKKQIE